MSKKLSADIFQKRFEEKCKGKLILCEPYINKRTPILVKCNECNYEHRISPDTILYKHNKLKPCFNCANPVVICDYCGIEFRKRKSEIEKTSKSYCSIKCRNKALNDVRRTPTINNYRTLALANYEHKCAVCGWDEDVDILEVHHIDEDREHNELSNLMILCPICHRKITSKKYKLVDNTLTGV